MTKFITLDALKVFLREIKRHIALAVRQQVDVTYAELVELRDNAKLIAGCLYRITDYVTKVYSASGFERSAEHPFDIIVRALSENTLAEEAYVAPRKGDEYLQMQISTPGKYGTAWRMMLQNIPGLMSRTEKASSTG